MFEDLSAKLESAFQSIKGQGKISDVNIAETMREIRRALLDADVNYEVARSFTDRVKEEVMGSEVLRSVSAGQQFTKIVYDNLVELLGSEKEEITFADTPPTVILIAGLQGSGKTTFAAKLANMLKSKGRNPMLAAADVYRPAAIEQLKTLASKIGVPVHSIDEQDAVRVARETVAQAKKNACDVVIVDTAGRMHVDEAMMAEVSEIKKVLSPSEILFVVDSMTGQDAVNTAREFNTSINFSGVVLTKLDGDTRGGAALSIKNVVQKPIKFISTGEKMDTISVFYPERMAQRILGMGDVVSLVEKAQEQIDEEEAKKLRRKISSETFNLEDFYNQLQSIKKMGSMSDIVGMIPGLNKAAMKNMDDIDDDALKPIESIINSMTVEERRNPQLLNGSRRKRIASGAGKSVKEVNDLIKQFNQMKKMMKSMSKGKKLQQLMQGFQSMPQMGGKFN